jgi:RnfABCDGE-type electron transport complex D subunit
MSQAPESKSLGNIIKTLINDSIFGGSERATREAPYIRDALGMQRYMGSPLLAVLPATLFSIYLWGWSALAVIAVAWLVGGVIELVVAAVRKTDVTEGFLVTGILFALLLPPTIYNHLWQVALGMAVAVLIGKELFGGLGKNIFNPALVGVAFLMIFFGDDMRSWLQPFWGTFPGGFAAWTAPLSSALGPDATPLLVFKETGKTSDLFTLLIGNHPGNIGETSALLLLLGGGFLLHGGIINGRISITILATVGALSYLFNMIMPALFPDPIFAVLSGSLILAAFLNATDPVTSPMTQNGKILYGLLIGILTVVIRAYTHFPDGVVFAILIANAFTPLLDKICKPKSFGGAPVS